ncbi:S24 family peptidase [Flavobacterium panacagri]|uniref:S24 family peptidase n=1 Tax=Flavobacterium panacagri TaxID=3034146 RepID=UPI0025A635C4|nr:S24 family peptidase [Flavobacterium panacagri]
MKEITLRFIEVYNHFLLAKKVDSASDFAKKVGISTSMMNEILKERTNVGIKPIQNTVHVFPEICLEWLIKGEGMMIKRKSGNEVSDELRKNEIIQSIGIPLIPIEAMAGYSAGEATVLELDCERFLIPTFKGADYLIQVKGSSMYPKYNSGDIVACKNLSLADMFFQWNKVYVLDTIQGALIKRIKKGSSEEHILIVSDNLNYDPFELHKSQIRAIAIVIGVIRLE